MTAIQTNQVKTTQTERYVNYQPASPLKAQKTSRYGKSIEELLASIYGGLARENATVEDISIRQNQLVVKYKNSDSAKKEPETSLDQQAVELSNVDVYSLDNGQVIERFNPVYQVKR